LWEKFKNFIILLQLYCDKDASHTYCSCSTCTTSAKGAGDSEIRGKSEIRPQQQSSSPFYLSAPINLWSANTSNNCNISAILWYFLSVAVSPISRKEFNMRTRKITVYTAKKSAGNNEFIRRQGNDSLDNKDPRYLSDADKMELENRKKRNNKGRGIEGKYVFKMENVSKYIDGDRPLFENLNLQIWAGYFSFFHYDNDPR